MKPRGIFPPPVIECIFADGQVVRMSFWSQFGKPWDIGRGRRLCKNYHRTLTGQEHDIIAGHVEHDDDDPAH